MTKALTLWQPWASLVGLGVKTIETRSWGTSYRGPLAIHAAKTMPPYSRRYVRGVSVNHEIEELGGSWWMSVYPKPPRPMGESSALGDYPCPLGAVVATCTLLDVVPTDAGWWCDPVQWGESTEDEEYLRSVGWGRDGDGYWFGTDQRPYGDFSPGRYAWLLADIEPLADPIPAKGRQGLWEWRP